MLELIHHYAGYGLWADLRFLRRLEREPDDTLDAPAPGSFPTLRATLLHIRDAEHTWWGRLTGTPTAWPASSDRSIAGAEEHFQRFHDLVIGCDEDALRMAKEYRDLRGSAHRQPAWQMIMHCINHGTQHRGQLITQMRSLGLAEIPANDLVAYQRAIAKG